MNNNQRIIITPGEPAGIGPDLVIMLAQQTWSVELVICADPLLLTTRAQQLNMPLRIYPYSPTEKAKQRRSGELTVLTVKTLVPVTTSKLNSVNSHYVIETLNRACNGCLRGEFAALVTGPVHKAIINDSGLPFIGHTEYLAKQSGKNRLVMMLVTKSLRVALATTHLPLIDVPSAITRQSLNEIITILNQDINQKFGIKNPCIYVCGLNPHAGENGYIGREEIEVIIPTINTLRAKGYNLVGPLPADTLFQLKYLNQADVILAMYHDQGLPVLKYQGFGQAVNVTLGLPFIRTSVDHGTALELAGSGNIKVSSIKAAINLAINMIKKNDN